MLEWLRQLEVTKGKPEGSAALRLRLVSCGSAAIWLQSIRLSLLRLRLRNRLAVALGIEVVDFTSQLNQLTKFI